MNPVFGIIWHTIVESWCHGPCVLLLRVGTIEMILDVQYRRQIFFFGSNEFLHKFTCPKECVSAQFTIIIFRIWIWCRLLWHWITIIGKCEPKFNHEMRMLCEERRKRTTEWRWCHWFCIDPWTFHSGMQSHLQCQFRTQAWVRIFRNVKMSGKFWYSSITLVMWNTIFVEISKMSNFRFWNCHWDEHSFVLWNNLRIVHIARAKKLSLKKSLITQKYLSPYFILRYWIVNILNCCGRIRNGNKNFRKFVIKLCSHKFYV